MRWILAFAGAFLLGSLPWGLWFGRWMRGIDIRQFGSGNLGATNVYRILGPRAGVAVLLLDAGKGAVAVWLARWIGGSALPPEATASGVALVGMVGAILGHSFTPFARFRGGKGVATAAGAWGVLAPAPLGLALAIWGGLFAATRIVSLASIAAALALPVAAGLLGDHPLRDPVFWAAVLTGVLLVLRHRANIGRLLRGREASLRLRGGKPAGDGSATRETASGPERPSA